MNEWTYNHLFYFYLNIKNGQFPKILNLKTPKSFNEKTIWLKMNYSVPNGDILADKILVKNYVKNIIGEEYVIPNIAVYESVENIDFQKLPNSFVLKANHGSGWNIICNDKSNLNIRKTKKILNNWLQTNYYYISKEHQYRYIQPKIFSENYIYNTPENPLIDYKIFCFNGKPKLVQVDLDRFTNHTRNFYDLNWEIIPFTTLYPLGKKVLPKPVCLNEMIEVASKLSQGLLFSRIDLYLHQNKIFFGEITLLHGGGFEPFIPKKYDNILGEYIEMPK